jgi:tRNA modification GTPase
MDKSNHTIAAIATPIGEGGISIIRISGTNSIEVAEKCFKGKQPFSGVQSHTAHYGTFSDKNGEIVDEVVVTIFRNPHSYTGEDVVEINCHGGIFITRKILEIIIASGARLAEPGEFTKRAYLNGRIDLAQAEAVADLISSHSELSRKASLLQLQGSISRKMSELRRQLLDICSSLELEIDFSEEGVQLVGRKKITKDIVLLQKQITQLIVSYELGKVYREGVRVVLTGRPNVGKSSLMNALLEEERAIVTHISGTTRDTIEENIVIDGVMFTIIDTAGLQETRDIVEKEGIRRAKEQIESADIVIFIMDAVNITDEDIDFFKKIFSNKKNGKKTILAINKIDLLPGRTFRTLPKLLQDFQQFQISAKEGIGIVELRNGLKRTALGRSLHISVKSLFVINLRHKVLLERAKTSLERSIEGIKKAASNEFIIIDLRDAINSIGEITGEITSQEILDNIFSRFCIGK